MENNAQLLKGVLEYCVLKLIAQEPTYGYEIVMHLKQVGFSDLSESTLYPLLLRLEQQGKVTVERRPSPKGPSRKYYIVTEEGRLALLEFRQDWSQLCQLVEKFLRRSQMNKYFALRKTNRMRTKLLTEESQAQLKTVSFDFGRKDLCGRGQAQLENTESRGLLLVCCTSVFLFGWGIEGLLLYPIIGNWVFELSVGYLMQLVVAVAAFCILFRRMMEQVGFPPREHWLKYAAWLVLYIVILYGTGWFFTQIAGNLVLLRLPILSYSIFCLLLGAGLYAIHFWRYGNDPRLSARI